MNKIYQSIFLFKKKLKDFPFDENFIEFRLPNKVNNENNQF